MRTIASRARCRSMTLLLGLAPALAWSAPVPAGGGAATTTVIPRTLSVGVYDSGQAPFESIEGGQVRGLGPDTLAQLAARLKLQVRYRHYPDWPQLLDAACRGEIDIVMNIAAGTERTSCMTYTASYASAPFAVVGRPGDLRASEDPDLNGLRVVIEREVPTADLVRRRFPAARQLVASDTLSALQKIANGSADVFIGNAYVASRLIDDHALANVVLLRPGDLPATALRFGVAAGRTPLRDALDEALSALPARQRAALSARWLRVPVWSDPARQALDRGERRALATPLRLGFPPDAPPLSFVDEAGRPAGLAGDYLQRLREAGATLAIIPSHDGYDLREKMRTGRIDAAIAVANDAVTLGPGWVFSQPFISVPNVIVTGPGSGTVLDLGDLSGKRVLLSDPDRLRAQVLQRAPRARIVAARSTAQALQRLRDGEAHAYIGNLAVVERLLRERGSGPLKIAAPAGFDDHLSLAVQRRYAPLATRFDRLLQDMAPQQREALRHAWLAGDERDHGRWHAIARWAVPLALTLLAALLVHLLGGWRLRREIAARRQLETRLADVTGSLPAVVYQMRRPLHGPLGFPYVAGDMQPLFGIDSRQAMASAAAVLERIDARDRERVEAAIEQAARDFLPLALEFRTLAVDGPRWVRTQAQPYASQAGTVTWSGYWVDVSEAHAQAEALVQAKSAAEQAAIAKAGFLATMSHEIRTPMSGVLGMLEMLAHSPLQAGQRMHLAEAERAAQELRQMLDAILDYAKIDAGALRLEPLPLPLRPIFDALQRTLTPLAVERGLCLRLEVDERLAAAHEVDGLRLRQVLHNLLGNAIRFTVQGQVSLRVQVLEGSTASLQELRLQVSDTGIGMDAARLQEVLQPLAAGAAVGQAGGAGLGLTICHSLVRLMGGQLRVRSRPGSGTDVDVLLQLPVASDDDLAATLPGPGSVPPLPPPLQQAHVLVVEDHPTAQAMMAWRLQQLGVRHAVASDGREALQQLAASPFDLVITDCRMPVMDGYAFTRLLREREERQGGRRVPVVALTASLLEDDLRRCREAGMDEVLTKPLSLAHLRQCLLRWLPAAGSNAGVADAY